MPALRDRREDLPDLLRFVLLEALRSDGLRPLVRQYLARFPTPDDFRDDASAIVFGRPAARDARRDAFTVFHSRAALARLERHDWPGNVRELRLFAINALVFTLAAHLDAAVENASPAAPRAPAVLAIPDGIVDRLLDQGDRRQGGGDGAGAPAAAPRTRLGGGAGPGPLDGRRLEVELPQGPGFTSFAGIAAEIERQYLKAVFFSARGDLGKVATLLLGPQGTARQVNLRLNQLGLKLRELRATLTER
jgi:two-component system nitrogen regulation response regulator GlnG